MAAWRHETLGRGLYEQLLTDRLITSVPFFGLEALKGDRKGQHSIRINNQWRVCFQWNDGDAVNVEIVDYH